MLPPLSSLGVATLCCYVPTTVAATVLYFKQRKSPVPALWVLLLIMCLVRIAGAVLLLLIPIGNTDVDVAAYAILSAGGLTVVLVMILLLSVIRSTEGLDDSASHYGIVALRFLFLTVLALTIAGIRMHIELDEPNIVYIGGKLLEAGAILSILLLAICFCGEMYIWVKHRTILSPKSRKILMGNMVIKPLVSLRLVYFCLAVFSIDSADARWNPLTGSMAALVCMVLLPEFITVVVYIWVGFTIDAHGIYGNSSGHGKTESGTKINDGEQAV